VLNSTHATPTQQLIRHRCRNARCGGKLKTPADNLHRAFCCSGCHAAFYRNRCLVCETKLPSGGPANREVCRRAECRAELRKFPQRYRWSRIVKRPPRSADKTGLKIGTKTGRPLRIVAGPAPAQINLRIPLDPGLAAKLDRVHADYFAARRKAKWHAARRAQVKRHHAPLNLLGGYRFPDAPTIDMSPMNPAAVWAITSRWSPTGDGASVEDIPKFLQRGVSLVTAEAA
jgi:hypothetical protein